MKDFMQQDKQYIIAMAIQMFWYFQRKAGTAYEKKILSVILAAALCILMLSFTGIGRESCVQSVDEYMEIKAICL